MAVVSIVYIRQSAELFQNILEREVPPLVFGRGDEVTREPLLAIVLWIIEVDGGVHVPLREVLATASYQIHNADLQIYVGEHEDKDNERTTNKRPRQQQQQQQKHTNK